MTGDWPADEPWGVAGARVDPAPPGAEEFAATPLIDLLRAAAERHPDAPALTSQAGGTRFAEMLRHVQTAACVIAASVPPGAAVACLVSRTPEAMAALIGCAISGRVALILDLAHPPERQAELLAGAGHAALLTDRDPAFEPRAPVVLVRDAVAGPDRTWRPDHAWDPDAPFVVHYTSGITGVPKGIALSARSMLYRGFDGTRYFALNGDDRLFAPSIPVGGNGMAVLLAALANGVEILLGSVAADGVEGYSGCWTEGGRRRWCCRRR